MREKDVVNKMKNKKKLLKSEIQKILHKDKETYTLGNLWKEFFKELKGGKKIKWKKIKH